MNAKSQNSFLPGGAQIGVYEIKEHINTDYVGFLYRAWNHHMNAPVLIKEYFPEYWASRSLGNPLVLTGSKTHQKHFGVGLSAFLDQARLLADIQHNSIVRVDNVLEFNNTAYQIMEIEKGRRLSKLLDESISLSIDQLELMFNALLDGLEQVHDRGLLHGGIYPGSILIRPNGTPVLIDFSAEKAVIAEIAGSDVEDSSDQYMPPEPLESGSSLSPRIDIYSLAVTLYRCLAATEPASAAARIAAITRKEVDPMVTLHEEIVVSESPDWISLLNSMCSLDVKQRPESVTQIKLELSNIRQAAELLTAKPGIFNGLEGRVGVGFWMKAACLVLALGLGFVWFDRESLNSPVVSNEITIKESHSSRPEDQLGIARVSEPKTSDQSMFDSSTKGSNQPKIRPHVGAEGDTLIHMDSQNRNRDLSLDSSFSAQQENKKSVVMDGSGNGEINALLAAASRNLEQYNLTTPMGDNAYQNYQDILKIAPGNTAASDGMRQVFIRYTWLINHSIEQGRYRNATLYLKRAEGLAESNEDLERFRKKLSLMQNVSE